MSRPNVLLITTDQQRFDTIHALGADIYTPHLNWLVDEGITFTRCYTDSPVCMAARATIMTGLHGYTSGLKSNSDFTIPMRDNPTLPAVLTKSGYQTRAQGKMHFYPMRANYGFEHMELPMDYYRAMASTPHVPKGHGVGENEIEPVISTVDEVHSATRWTATRTIDFLETRDETRPFFVWTSYAKPHPPFDPSPNYWALYQNKILPPPIESDWSKEKRQGGFMASTYNLNNGYRMTASQKQDVKRAYYACITQIDYSLGLLFARMREMGLLENTWIIFTSDHGDMMGDHGMFAKSVLFEGSAHIPMIVRPPSKDAAAIHAGKQCDSLVTLADVMPTILSAAGVEALPKCDGINMLDLIDKDESDRLFYGNYNDEYLAVIKDNIKYTWCRRGGGELMFDLTSDPMETQDLVPSNRKLAEEMKAILYERISSHGGDLTAGPPLAGPQSIRKGPGLHSTVVPTDVLH